jgi:UDP-glucose 4-epimerase
MILVTGGTGYIGSHTCVELIEAGHEVVVFDNLSNSNSQSLCRIQQMCGRKPIFEYGDLRDTAALAKLFRTYPIKGVLHFAGLKAVGDSVRDPVSYYDNNVVGTLRLIAAMQDAGVKKIVFSSSATVYGVPKFLPFSEDHPLSATNPYGRTKLMVEEMLKDQFRADPEWRIAVLRYFNPVGAHEAGLIGEDPIGVPGNLVPFIAQVAVGLRERVNVWGNDYPTHDGTGVRDYVHVMDLAAGHLAALNRLNDPQYFAVNLGTGRGNSVLEVISAFESASGRKIPYAFCARRDGDIPIYYADPSQAESLLGWKARRSLQEMCADHWRWQKSNPNGYGKAGL